MKPALLLALLTGCGACSSSSPEGATADATPVLTCDAGIEVWTPSHQRNPGCEACMWSACAAEECALENKGQPWLDNAGCVYKHAQALPPAGFVGALPDAEAACGPIGAEGQAMVACLERSCLPDCAGQP